MHCELRDPGLPTLIDIQGEFEKMGDEDCDLVEISFPTVNSLGGVKVKTNASSVPVRAGTTVGV